jgi:hypothetical protein
MPSAQYIFRIISHSEYLILIFIAVNLQLPAKVMASPATLGNLVAEGAFCDIAITKATATGKAALQDHAGRNCFAISVDSSSNQRVFYK